MGKAAYSDRNPQKNESGREFLTVNGVALDGDVIPEALLTDVTEIRLVL